jgi:hypothetical protein
MAWINTDPVYGRDDYDILFYSDYVDVEKKVRIIG